MQNPETVLANEVNHGRTPAVQYVFFNENNTVYEFLSGFADLKEKRKADHRDTFPIFSITKTFTALAVMQLVQKARITLDRPVQFYMPDSPLSEKITVRHLLTHTSGLANPFPLNWVHLKKNDASFNRNEFFRPVIERSIHRKSIPGEKFRYSNVGYVILGMLIETIANTTYEKFIRENIFEKLMLHHDVLDFDIPHSGLHMRGYHKTGTAGMLLLRMLMQTSSLMEEPTGKWKPFREFYMNGTSYGGIIANSGGMIRYARELLKIDSVLISAEYKKQLFTENLNNAGKPTGMCLSWYKGNLDGRTYFAHAGGGGGYYCELRLYPDMQSGSFVVFNRSGFSDKRFLDRVDKRVMLLNKL